LKIRTLVSACALALAGIAAPFAAMVPTATVAHAIPSEPPYSPNSNPALNNQSTYCYSYDTDPNNGPPCYRWVRVGGAYMQGTQSQWIGESALIAVTCSFGKVTGNDFGGLGHWHWVYTGSGPSAPFCLAGSPTPFWKRSEGASG
jgi:hypothetical protein